MYIRRLQALFMGGPLYLKVVWLHENLFQPLGTTHVVSCLMHHPSMVLQLANVWNLSIVVIIKDSVTRQSSL